MSARLEKLEALLTRVQERSQEPRTAAAASPQIIDELELDEPGESVLPPAPVDEDSPDSLDDFDDDLLDDVPQSGQAVANFQNDEGPSAPPMTPPPESGEGVASPQIPKDDGPTPEQIGATISLEGSGEHDLQLDEPTLESVPPSGGPILEADITSMHPPQPKSAESTMTDLQRMRLGEETPIEARVSARPVASTRVVDYVEASKNFAPKSFLELLDASLSLE